MSDTQQKWRGEPSTVGICYFLVAMLLLANSFIGHFHDGEEHILTGSRSVFCGILFGTYHRFWNKFERR